MEEELKMLSYSENLTDQALSQLKDDNERLRGERGSLLQVLYKLSKVTQILRGRRCWRCWVFCFLDELKSGCWEIKYKTKRDRTESFTILTAFWQLWFHLWRRGWRLRECQPRQRPQSVSQPRQAGTKKCKYEIKFFSFHFVNFSHGVSLHSYKSSEFLVTPGVLQRTCFTTLET